MKISKTIKQMLWVTGILFLLTAAFFAAYHVTRRDWMRPLYITLLTAFYHFAMRLAVGEAVAAVYKNREFHPDSLGFRIRSYEPKLYQLLRVKKWKSKVITADPGLFDLRKRSPEELLHSMLQAELVHRVIMVLSFLPLLLILPYGEPGVFIGTSIAACAFDAVFVIIQRYNRPRIIRLIMRKEKR